MKRFSHKFFMLTSELRSFIVAVVQKFSMLTPLLQSFIVAVAVGIIAAFFKGYLFVILHYFWGMLVSLKDTIQYANHKWISSNDNIIGLIILSIIGTCISWPLTHQITKAIVNKKAKRHFAYSFKIIKKQIIPSIKKLVKKNDDDMDQNHKIDCYVQSPLEYVNEALRGNELPEFNPNDTYQDAIFDDEIKYIVAITAENPNLFLNPSIGFYMSNCYAVSLIRHLQDFIKKTKHTQDSKLQLDVKDMKVYNNKIKPQICQVINTLKDEKRKLETFEFVRFFIFDEHQKECCKDAIFPSLKASQDLFRTISFYIQKKELEESLGKNDNKWEEFKEISNALWDLIGEKYEIAPSTMEILNRRKDDVIPEFLLVFYENKIVIHTYLGGKPYSWDSKNDSEPKEKDKVEEKIRLFTKLLANYVSKGKGQLKIDDNKNNQRHTFINWEWSLNSDEREQYSDSLKNVNENSCHLLQKKTKTKQKCKKS